MGEAVHLGMPPALLQTALIRRLLGLVVQLVAPCFLDYRLHRRADPDSLLNKVLDPLNASDLLLAVEAVAARRALRTYESVPVLPGAERRRRDPCAPAYGFQGQAGRQRWRKGT